jgi:hypothetical protein
MKTKLSWRLFAVLIVIVTASMAAYTQHSLFAAGLAGAALWDLVLTCWRGSRE